MNMPTSPKHPAWWQTAVETPSERGETIVSGTRINFQTWGDRGLPGIVLVHGSNAHLEWWRTTAPLLANHFRVTAMDSSGAGDSGWRAEYSGAVFAEEIMAVADAVGLGKRPYIVGHSFGGFATLEAGHCFGKQLGGIVMVDFTVYPPHFHDEFREMREQRKSEPVRPTRVYPDKETALSRFRLVPEQSCKNPFVIDYIAERSIREVDGGWTWKFDPGMFRNLSMDEESGVDAKDKLLNLNCRSAFIMGEQSLDYSQESLDYTRNITQGLIPMFEVPCTHHHLMFDEPIGLAMAIKGILLTWHTMTE